MCISNEKLITIATFDEAPLAHIAQSRLEAEGVESYLADENIINMNWLLTNATGGIKLQVKQNEAAHAIDILHNRKSLGDKVGKTENTDQLDDDNIYCPRCHSANVYFEKVSRRIIFLSILLLGFPVPFIRSRWCCNDCGYKWKKQKMEPTVLAQRMLIL